MPKYPVRIQALILISLFLLSLPNFFQLPAAVCQSNGTGGGLWFNAATWINCNGAPPQAGDSVQIMPGDTISIESSLLGYSIASVTVENGGTLSIGSVSENLVVDGNMVIDGVLELSTGGGSLEVGGNLIKGSAGAFTNNGKAVIFNGGAAQEISGSFSTSSNRFEKINVQNNSTVTFNNNIGVETGLEVEVGSLFQSEGSARFTQEVANDGILDCDGICVFDDLIVRRIDMSGSTGNLAVNGDFTIQNASSIVVMPGAGGVFSVAGGIDSNITSGTFDANGGTITLDGATMQTVDAAGPIALDGLIVGTGTTLVEAQPADNLSVISLTNNGTIRKAQTISGTGTLSFGLTNVTMNVDNYSAPPTITVDRVDGDHPGANRAIAGSSDMHWNITATGIFQVDVVFTDPTVSNINGQKTCRFNGTGWGCETDLDGAAGTTTRNDVTAFSGWQNCDGCGPTAVTLRSFEANASAHPWKLVLAFLALGITIPVHRFIKRPSSKITPMINHPTINLNQ